MGSVQNHGYAYRLANGYCKALELTGATLQTVTSRIASVVLHPVETVKGVTGYSNFAQIPDAWKDKRITTVIRNEERASVKIKQTVTHFEWGNGGVTKKIGNPITTFSFDKSHTPATYTSQTMPDTRSTADRVGHFFGHLISGSAKTLATGSYLYGTAANMYANYVCTPTNGAVNTDSLSICTPTSLSNLVNLPEYEGASRTLAFGVNKFFNYGWSALKDGVSPACTGIIKAAVRNPQVVSGMVFGYLACKEFTKAANSRSLSGKIGHGAAAVASAAVALL